ncbi:MAG: class I SAM-dependent methyltransferase [Candidatus Heteroscillospira sp.]|jgi:SAM-dependent methyltransferase
MEHTDYAKLWREAMERKTNIGNPYKDNPECAVNYDRSEKIWSDGAERAQGLPFGPADTVLDIGSGPGVLAVPLAGKVRAVTAVEPSDTMLNLMHRHCVRENIHNIRTVCGNWEDVSVSGFPEHDYVIASYSLNMPDILPALAAMDKAARKKVYLYWFCGLASWEKLLVDLYPAVHGYEFHAQPKSDVLYGVLSQMGISADVEDLEDTSFDRGFADMDSAVGDLRRRLRLTDRKHDDVLADYIRQNYIATGDGWVFRDETHYVCISWTPALAKEECA